MNKHCPRCDYTLPQSRFSPGKRPGKLYHICKNCKNLARQGYHAAHKRERAQYQRDYYKKHADRKKARCSVRHALSVGKIEKMPCEVCGDVKVDAHHDDYSERLNVRWLCRQHHFDLHVTPSEATERSGEDGM